MDVLPQIELPAGDTVVFEPDGKHVILMGMKQELTPGDTLDLTLNFETAGPITLAIEVQDGPTGHDDHDHMQSEHDMDLDDQE